MSICIHLVLGLCQSSLDVPTLAFFLLPPHLSFPLSHATLCSHTLLGRVESSVEWTPPADDQGLQEALVQMDELQKRAVRLMEHDEDATEAGN